MIASVAFGLAWLSYYQDCENAWESIPEASESTRTVYLVRLLSWWHVTLSHVAGALTLGLLVVRIRKERPSLSRLARQPGAVACAAASLAMVVEMIPKMELIATQYFVDKRPFEQLGEITCFNIDVWLESFAVALAWLLLSLGGRWRREPGWIDGLGIALGAWWLLPQVILNASEFLFMLLRL
jgi:hypothetical protein